MSQHVIPLHDEREHTLSQWCWCEPKVEWINPATNVVWPQPIITHNAADCREIVEQATNEKYGGWKLVESDQ